MTPASDAARSFDASAALGWRVIAIGCWTARDATIALPCIVDLWTARRKES